MILNILHSTNSYDTISTKKNVCRGNWQTRSSHPPCCVPSRAPLRLPQDQGPVPTARALCHPPRCLPASRRPSVRRRHWRLTCPCLSRRLRGREIAAESVWCYLRWRRKIPRPKNLPSARLPTIWLKQVFHGRLLRYLSRTVLVLLEPEGRFDFVGDDYTVGRKVGERFVSFATSDLPLARCARYR